ncbi:MAG: hypothetical protein Q9196_000169 [Gyalolechia fulgens]
MALRGLEELPDLQINDAIAQQDWRHALQLIEKREKRAKKDQSVDWLKACKASVLFLLPESAKHRQGRSLLDSLYEKKPPVVDINAAMTIQAFAEQRKDFDPRIDELWMQVANAHPNDEGMHKHWFSAKFCTKDWQGARKAAMAYMKHFPSKREPFFWVIFANFMASKSLKSAEQEMKLCGTMAYRMCAKAAEGVPLEADKVRDTSRSSVSYGHGAEREKALNNSRILCTPGEIAFLLDVYESQGKREEALAILESDRTGLSSSIGKHSWDLILRKIQLSESMGRWLEQFRYSFGLLEDALPSNRRDSVHGLGETGNSWSVWVAVLKVAANLRQCKVKVEDWYPKLAMATGPKHRVRLSHITATVCTQYSESSKDRDGMSARMLGDFSDASTIESIKENEADLVEACLTYFKVYGKKQFCYNDLEIFVQGFNPVSTQSFLQEAKLWCLGEQRSFFGQDQVRDLDDPDMEPMYDAAYLIMQVNLLKLEYHLVHSRWEGSANTEDAIGIEKFIVQCIEIYISAVWSYPVAENAGPPTERLPGDDAGLLAAIGLIRLGLIGNRQHALLQAVAILQHLTQKSPFNYEALVTLTVLYTRIGAGWLAAECYSRLSIKNIQFPTLSWLLCTRISTIHPHSPLINFKTPSEKVDADAIQHLSRALDYHLHLCETDQQEIYDFLEAGQYANLLQAMGNSVYNQLGFTRYMLLVEWARLERFSGAPSKVDIRSLSDRLPLETIDNRDRSPIPHWEAPDAVSLEEMLLPGKWPSHKWLSGQLFVAVIFEATTKTNTSFDRDDVSRGLTASNDLEDSSTPVENRQVDLAKECDSLIRIYEETGSDAKTKIHDASAVVQGLGNIRQRQEETNETIATMSLGDGCHLWKITESANAPDWEFFHIAYVGLDSCRLIERTIDFIEAQNRKVRLIKPEDATEQIRRIRKLCDEYRMTLNSASFELSESLSDKRHQEELLYTIINRPGDMEDTHRIAYWLRHLFVDEQYARGILARLQLAWKEALANVDSLTRVKVPA